MKLFVKVKPNSSERNITKVSENNYSIKLKSPAEKNKANLELIKIISKEFKVPQKKIIIKAGLSNRDKLIEIKNEI